MRILTLSYAVGHDNPDPAQHRHICSSGSAGTPFELAEVPRPEPAAGEVLVCIRERRQSAGHEDSRAHSTSAGRSQSRLSSSSSERHSSMCRAVWYPRWPSAYADCACSRRALSRTPEVVVKVLTRGGQSLKAVRAHLAYLNRGGELEIETDDGERLAGDDVERQLLNDWDLDMEAERGCAELTARRHPSPPKLVHKILFSMPPGTSSRSVPKAVREFGREEFGLRHRYALVLGAWRHVQHESQWRSWSTGRSGRYPYYLCVTRGCESYGKSIRRDTLEGEFESLLKQLVPSESLFKVARAMFKDLWSHQLKSGEQEAGRLRIELARIEMQVSQLLDRITATDVPSVVGAYEKRIRELEDQKILTTEAIANCGRPRRPFDETLRTALDFLANRWQLWKSERLEDKKTVLKLAFADRLAYVRREGFRTATLSLPFKALESLSAGENTMAHPTGRSSNQDIDNLLFYRDIGSLLEQLAEWNVRLGAKQNIVQPAPAVR